MPTKIKKKEKKKSEHKATKLAELHSHIGASAQPAVLWRIAHEQGIKLPTKDFWHFKKLITITKPSQTGFTSIDRDKYHWTELIQSSPLAMGPVVQQTISGAYRSANIVVNEIRYNPMKRNRGGERDLDHIILATIHGMERALLEYPAVKVGIILELDRTFTRKMNEILYHKAIKYQHRGIIGIDVAGPQSNKFKMKDYINIFQDAKKRGFGVTVHTGEEGSLNEMRLVVNDIRPHRIGHGIMSHKDKDLMKEMKKNKIVLEVCPTSNLNVGIIKNTKEMRKIYRTIHEAGVKMTINTDGPEMHLTSLQNEFNLLIKNKIFTEPETKRLIKNAFEATFITDRLP